MRIKLTTDITDLDKSAAHGCVAGKEFEAVLIHPRSTTVEFISDEGKEFRAFYYEYEVIESVEE